MHNRLLGPCYRRWVDAKRGPKLSLWACACDGSADPKSGRAPLHRVDPLCTCIFEGGGPDLSGLGTAAIRIGRPYS